MLPLRFASIVFVVVNAFLLVGGLANAQTPFDRERKQCFDQPKNPYEIEVAINSCRVMLGSVKNKSNVLVAIGSHYERLNRLAEAKDSYLEALQLGNRRGAVFLANLLTSNAALDCNAECLRAAIDYYERGFKESKSEVDVLQLSHTYVRLGLLVNDKTLVRRGLAEMENGLSVYPESLRLRHQLARLYLSISWLPDRDIVIRGNLEAIWKSGRCKSLTLDCANLRDLALLREQGIGGAVDRPGAKEIQDWIGDNGMAFSSQWSNPERADAFRRPARFTTKSSKVNDSLKMIAVKELDVGRSDFFFDTSIIDSDDRAHGTAHHGEIIRQVERASDILAQCGVRIRNIKIFQLNEPIRTEANEARHLFEMRIRSSITNLLSEDFTQRIPHEVYGIPVLHFANEVNLDFGWAEYTRGFVGMHNLLFGDQGGFSSTLAHEYGHILSLNHKDTIQPNLMGYFDPASKESIRLLPEQCEAMRSSTFLTPSAYLRLPPSANVSKASDALAQAFRYLVDNINYSEGSWASFNACDLVYLSQRFGISEDSARRLIGHAIFWPGKPEDFDAKLHLETVEAPKIRVKGSADDKCVPSTLVKSNGLRPPTRFEIPGRWNFRLPDAGVRQVPWKAGQIYDPQAFAKRNLLVSTYDDRRNLVENSGGSAQSAFFFALVENDLLLIDAKGKYIIGGVRNYLNIFSGSFENAKKHWRFQDSKNFATLKPEDFSFSSKPTKENVSPVAATGELRQSDFYADTPEVLQGGLVATPIMAWHTLYNGNKAGKQTLVLSAIPADSKPHLPNAVDFSEFSRGGTLHDALQGKLVARMRSLGAKEDSEIIVYCEHQKCWLAYNLARRLISAGYRKVYWLRAGVDWWFEEGFPVAPLKVSAL